MVHRRGQWARGICLALGLVAALGLGGCGREKLDAGDRLLAQGKPAEAIDAWRKDRLARPRDTRLLIRIATAQTRMGELKEAEATLLHAIEIEPDSPKVRHNLGLVYMKQRDLDKALTTFHEVLELEETYPQTNYYIGLIHEMRGDGETADAYYIRDVNNGPSPAWDRIVLRKQEMRERGEAPPQPETRHVVVFSLALLGLAACAYGLRLYLERRGGPAAAAVAGRADGQEPPSDLLVD